MRVGVEAADRVEAPVAGRGRGRRPSGRPCVSLRGRDDARRLVERRRRRAARGAADALAVDRRRARSRRRRAPGRCTTSPSTVTRPRDDQLLGGAARGDAGVGEVLGEAHRCHHRCVDRDGPRPARDDARRRRRARLPRQAGVGVAGARRSRLRRDDQPAGGAARAAGRASVPFSTLTLEHEAHARDGTVKALFRTADGRPVEAVLMRYRDGRRSLCLSSQSGCPLTCTFCATGAMKFGRNLTAVGDPRPGAALPPHRARSTTASSWAWASR